jgi:hypothetical protein
MSWRTKRSHADRRRAHRRTYARTEKGRGRAAGLWMPAPDVAAAAPARGGTYVGSARARHAWSPRHVPDAAPVLFVATVGFVFSALWSGARPRKPPGTRHPGPGSGCTACDCSNRQPPGRPDPWSTPCQTDHVAARGPLAWSFATSPPRWHVARCSDYSMAGFHLSTSFAATDDYSSVSGS